MGGIILVLLGGLEWLLYFELDFVRSDMIIFIIVIIVIKEEGGKENEKFKVGIIYEVNNK